MSKSKHYTTALQDRIPIGQVISYAIGMLVNNLQAAALPAMIVILNLGLGMDPILVGLIGFAPRIVDAVSDVMMGYISDNTRSRFGRRRPYIFGGVIVAGIIFIIMWQLPYGQINIAAKKPVSQHKVLFPSNTNVIFHEGGQAILDYNQDNPSESGFVFYGPESLKLESKHTDDKANLRLWDKICRIFMANKPMQATNFSEYSSIEMKTEIPEDLSFEIIFNEAGAAPTSSETFDTLANSDGESFSFEASSKQVKDNTLKFNFSDLKPRTSYGNQNGKKQLDLIAIKNIVLSFPKLKGSGEIKINSIKLLKDGDLEEIDILEETSINQHKSFSSNDTTILFRKNGETVLNYNADQQSNANFVFYGPDSLALASDSALATNLDGYPRFELNVDVPNENSFNIFFDESDADDGESYHMELTPTKSGRELFKFELSELKRSMERGNQNGNNTLDIKSMKNISVNFADLQGAGALTVHSVTLRKSESFYTTYFWYFMAMSIFFFLAYTVFAVPFNALGYEMTPDYHERTRLQAWAQGAGQVAWIIAPWFWWTVYNDELFEGPVEGARTLAIIVGAFIAIVGVVPAIFTKERFVALPKNENRTSIWKHTKEFFKGIAITFACKPFVKICAVTFLVFNGFQLGISFSLYVMIFYLFGGDNKAAGGLQGWFGTASVLGTIILVIPLATWISSKLGKKKTLVITLSMAMVGYVVKWFGYNPDYPYLLLVSAPIVSFGIGSLFTMMGSMVADVCDYDELITGERREGVFSAIYWWMVKIGMSMAAVFTGVLLKTSGFDQALGTGNTQETLLYLRIFDIGIPMVTFAIAILIISTYKLSEKRLHEIRTELEQRRGKGA